MFSECRVISRPSYRNLQLSASPSGFPRHRVQDGYIKPRKAASSVPTLNVGRNDNIMVREYYHIPFRMLQSPFVAQPWCISSCCCHIPRLVYLFSYSSTFLFSLLRRGTRIGAETSRNLVLYSWSSWSVERESACSYVMGKKLTRPRK